MKTRSVPPPQRVTITVSTDPDDVTISVADKGHGMAAAVIGKIFDPFFSTKIEIIGQGMAWVCRSPTGSSKR